MAEVRRWRTVNVELVRVGPPSGQLLSRLAPYLALCAGHPAETIYLPFDQEDVEHHLGMLRYAEGPTPSPLSLSDRHHHRRVLGQGLAGLLRQIRGLVGPLQQGAEGEGVELRLITSADELALLPFELALDPELSPPLVPPGAPVILVREHRALGGPQLRWPDFPRLLLATSSAGGEVPTGHLLQGMRKALGPWLAHAPEDPEELGQLLSVLPEASLESLAERLQRPEGRPFTHLVLLCHGQLERGGGRLLLRKGGQVDRVDGGRLVSALGPAAPPVIIFAACDGGNRGDLRAAGLGSAAAAAHAAGVPLVVASQLPLSTLGAFHLVSRLLDGLLRGAHPASALWSTREVLRQVRHPEDLGGHDWAAMAAWARWPAEGDQHLRPARLNQLRRSLHSQASRLDPFQRRSEEWDGPRLEQEWSQTFKAFGSLRKEVDRLGEEWPDQRSALLGSWAGNLRRAADRLLGRVEDPPWQAQADLHAHRGLLQQAYGASLHAYRAIPRQRPGEEHYHSLQALLTARLWSAVGQPWAEEEEEQLVAEWIAAEAALSVWARERSSKDPEVLRGLLLLLLSRPLPELELTAAHLPPWALGPSPELMPPWSSLPWVGGRQGWDLRRLLWRAQRLSLADWAGAWQEGMLQGGAPLRWSALVE